jgi:hypothetical protein
MVEGDVVSRLLQRYRVLGAGVGSGMGLNTAPPVLPNGTDKDRPNGAQQTVNFTWTYIPTHAIGNSIQTWSRAYD